MADDPWAESSEGEEKTEQAEAKTSGEGQAGDDWADTMNDQDGASAPASFDELGGGASGEEGNQNLDFLLDIPLEVSAELGRSNIIINDLLQLTQGSVIELTKNAGEPVDIYVNKKMLGKGEVIVVNDRFGVRITEIISQADRVKNMS
jgi:flagellar motor switch protein FliN/FliY